MIANLLAGVVGAIAGVTAAPYLAGLTLTAAAQDTTGWWRSQSTTRRRRMATAATAVPLAALAGFAAGFAPVLPALLGLALVVTPAVIVDIQCHRLPDRLTATAALDLLVLLALAAELDGSWGRYLRAVEAATVVGLVLLALALLARGGFGLGDVKLGAVLAGALGWYGWGVVYLGLLCAFVLGAVVALVLLAAGRVGRRTALPFGPMLVLGTLLTLALG